MVSVLTVFGLIGIAANGASYLGLPTGIEFALKQFINLKEDGLVFPQYIDPPVVGTSTYYLYQVLNPIAVLGGAKPRLKLKGPYIYRTRMVRSNITFIKGSERLKYDTRRDLVLDEEASANLDEKFWMLNPTLPSAAKTVRSLVLDRIPFQRLAEPIVYNSVNVALDTFKERLFARLSPRQILQGQKVEMLATLGGLARRFGLGDLVQGPPDDIFGLGYAQNVTVDRLEIWTGVGNDKFAEVYRWKDSDKIAAWSGKCAIINGTNGELYKPNPQKGKPLKIFLGPLCRSFYINPISDVVEIYDGLKALEYEFTPRLYQGVQSNPKNLCYCTDIRAYDCQLDGLLSMGPCFFDAPLFFTRGNFKGLSRKLRSLIDETALNMTIPEKQSFYLDPITATVLKVNLTITGLFKVVKTPYLRDLSRVQNITYLPLFATSETIELPPKLTWQIKFLQKLLEKHKTMNAIGLVVGLTILTLKTLVSRRATKRTSRSTANNSRNHLSNRSSE